MEVKRQLLLLLIITATISVHTIGCWSYETNGWKKLNCPNSVTDITNNLEDWTVVNLGNCTQNQVNLTEDLHIASVNGLHFNESLIQKFTITCKINTSITFSNVTNLHLENLQILNCGNFDNAAVRIINCTNVTLKSIIIKDSKKTGLALINVGGLACVSNSHFISNGKMSKEEISITLQHSKSTQSNDFQKRGGGMLILVGNRQEDATVIIHECCFRVNSALDGGGLVLIMHQGAKRNNITITNTTFEKNSAHQRGGGLQIGYVDDDINQGSMTNNSIDIKQSNFSLNKAETGGGVAIFANYGSLEFSKNSITFTNCNWTNNAALLGLAVDISVAPWETNSFGSHLPSPVFTDCVFYENKDETVIEAPFILNKPRGTLVVTGFKVVFENRIVFENNLGSAIEAASSLLSFKSYSNVFFLRNHGLEGGAMSLKATSVVNIHDNSYFLFKDNMATFSGGAIFYEFSDKHNFFSSAESCFYKHVGSQQPVNVTLEFMNNTASNDHSSQTSSLRYRGDSVYATSLLPCIQNCLQQEQDQIHTTFSISDVLKCIGNFSLDSLNSTQRQFSTSPHHFALEKTEDKNDDMCFIHVNLMNRTIEKNPNYVEMRYNPLNETLHFVPGKLTRIPLCLVDDLCANVFFSVLVRVFHSNMSSISINSAHSVLTDNFITLYGNENDFGKIQLSTTDIRKITVTLNVTIDPCPPGYIHSNDSDVKCTCSSRDPMKHYRGIVGCNDSDFHALIQHGYWVGYIGEARNEVSLATTVCPKGFCSDDTRSSLQHSLPSSIYEDISPYICNVNRMGILCSQCKNNRSAFYHSRLFTCGSNNLCHLGWLFYILSELVPVTVLFLIVIFFNISFTSGALNGVIFFMQMIDSLKIKAENFIWFDQDLYNLSKCYKFLYRMFNLEFFALQEMSFCLWEGASALDLLAFRYVTIIYGLLLVIVTVVLLRVCNFTLCGRSFKNLKRSIIHGLSAFLVISYSECTRVSLMILTVSILRIGPNSQLQVEYRVFYNGEYPYMKGDHLKYALPAIFFVVTLVAVPPLLLLVYPLCYKIFGLLRIEESKFVQLTCKILPLEKIKPLFDSIQYDFKDNYRFFAGLYFIYRLVSLLSFTLTTTLTSHYSLTGALLVFILTIHAAFRPYRKVWHNLLDACLFCNLVIINAITYYNYSQVLYFYKENFSIETQILIGVQNILILLPFVYLIVFTVYSVVHKSRTSCAICQNPSRVVQDENSDDILNIIDDRSVDSPLKEESADYLLMDSYVSREHFA